MTAPPRPLIAITLGDPSGVGPEVVVRALRRHDLLEEVRPVLIGNRDVVRRAIDLVGSRQKVRPVDHPADAIGEPDSLDVLEVGAFEASAFPPGEHSLASGKASHVWVEAAARFALDREVDAICTAPVNKESWQLAGSPDTGHQEVLKRLSRSPYVATMLITGALRCMHLSTHLPLAEACAYVTRANVLRALRLTHDHFVRWGFDEPRIAVAALNPHAGDGGLIGREEIEEIAPAVEDAREEDINVVGPLPSDSVLPAAARGRYDVVLVMYHDQGHIAIKVHGAEESISVNLGLPFIRTSVDHGTAFDIAWQGRADERSMVEALRAAAMLATRRGLPRPGE